jgi:two-component system NarL family sensor kinase
MTESENQFLFILFGGIFFGLLMTFFILTLLFFHRQRQLQNKQKLEQIRIENEKTVLNLKNEVQQETLAHIGRELHDNIGQLLSLAKLNFQSLKPEKNSEGKLILNQIIKEVRDLSKTLNTDWVEDISLEKFILCRTTFEYELGELSLTKDQKLVLMRVTQECLNNAIKHASPELIEIKVYQGEKRRVIRIIDTGKGFDVSQPSQGSGMTNLKKRMIAIGGEFKCVSSIGKGTAIKLLF